MVESDKLPSSFRDPSGFLFQRNGDLFRQINLAYQDDFELLLSSGLYDQLTKTSQLIRHSEALVPPALKETAITVIRPDRIHFISYPYEWCFSQLKDAALLTLSIAKTAINYGMDLKDASAYNIQFHHGRPILIDTLSFEKYVEGQPWVAYKQFCQHFLAPLALMSLTDIRLNQLMRIYIDGIPLDLASKLLPWKSHFNFGLLTHIHTHASSQKKYSGQESALKDRSRGVSKMAMLGLLDSLETTIHALAWKPLATEWAQYYDSTNYDASSFEMKKRTVKEASDAFKPKMIWDLGANTGEFSRATLPGADLCVCFDIDPGAVEINYISIRKNNEDKILPLVLDLTNPSGGVGWQNEERDSLLRRGPADLVLALALVHHLAISNNVPLDKLAEFLSLCGKNVVVEFVPKEDSQVVRLLATRKDIFPDYHQAGFEKAFRSSFKIKKTIPVSGSKRVVYWLEKK